MLNLDPSRCNLIVQPYLSSGVLVPGANDNTARVFFTCKAIGRNFCECERLMQKKKKKNLLLAITVFSSETGPVECGCSVTISHLDQHLSKEANERWVCVCVCVCVWPGFTGWLQYWRAKQHRDGLQRTREVKSWSRSARACWNNGLGCSKYWLCSASVYLWGFSEKLRGNSFFRSEPTSLFFFLSATLSDSRCILGCLYEAILPTKL